MRKKIFVSLLFLIIGGICAYRGFIFEPNSLNINDYHLKLKKWSPQLNGLKIVAISDIHAGSNFITADKIQNIAREINAQSPDMIFLLGDYVATDVFDKQNLKMPVKTITENLSGLHAKYGVFAVLGNEDEAFDPIKVRNELEKIGIKVLSNESVSIDINGEKLRLLGMKDKMISGNWHDISNELKKVLAEENSTGNILVLVHNPDYLRVISGDFSISDNVSLVLAGHTHGGQVQLPFIGSPFIPSEYGQKYAGGFVHDQDTDMFVTTGIGTSKIPVRFGVPPEIAVLTLYSE